LPDELAAVAAKWNVGKTFADYRKLLELADVDAVAICTPTNTHYQMILEAAAAGKHIFCEKPIDLSIEKIVAINAEVKARGVQLMVGFNRRYDPNFLKVHDTVKAGGIGEPHICESPAAIRAAAGDYIRASGGIFLDMTIHDFDMARYLMGDVVEVYARANVLVTRPSGRPAIGHGDGDADVRERRAGRHRQQPQGRLRVRSAVEVFGSEGMIAVKNNTHDNHVRLDSAGTHSALPLDFFMDRYAESYLKEMEAFVDAVRGQRLAPVNGNDGLMAVVIGLAAAKSARENRPVKLDEIYERRS